MALATAAATVDTTHERGVECYLADLFEFACEEDHEYVHLQALAYVKAMEPTDLVDQGLANFAVMAAKVAKNAVRIAERLAQERPYPEEVTGIFCERFSEAERYRLLAELYE